MQTTPTTTVIPRAQKNQARYFKSSNEMWKGAQNTTLHKSIISDILTSDSYFHALGSGIPVYRPVISGSIAR